MVNGLVDSLTGSKSLLRLAVKTNGIVFSVKDGPNGEGVVSVHLPIADILPETFTLCAKDYDDYKAFMKDANNGKPQPPQGPKGPGV